MVFMLFIVVDASYSHVSVNCFSIASVKSITYLSTYLSVFRLYLVLTGHNIIDVRGLFAAINHSGDSVHVLLIARLRIYTVITVYLLHIGPRLYTNIIYIVSPI